jgi:hypothetical protein
MQKTSTHNMTNLAEELKAVLQGCVNAGDYIGFYKVVLTYKSLGVAQNTMYEVVHKIAADYYDLMGELEFYNRLYDLLDALVCSPGYPPALCIYSDEYVLPEWVK